MDLTQKKSSSTGNNIVPFYGVIERESEEYFRLYPNPKQKNRYFRIGRKDIIGQFREITEEEINEAGFAERFQFSHTDKISMTEVPIKKDSLMEYIHVEEAKAGAFYPIDAVKYCFNNDSEEPELVSLCRTKIPCASGCCMTKFGHCECSTVCNSNCTYP